ncbi:unnamed protein product [Gadus morhua 'NCC']
MVTTGGKEGGGGGVVSQTPRGHLQNDIIIITSHKASSPQSRRWSSPAPPPPAVRVHVRGGDADRRRVHFMAVRVVYIQKPSVRVCYDVCVWENVCVNEKSF